MARVEMRPRGNKGWRDVSRHVVRWDGHRLVLDSALAQTVAMRSPAWRVDGRDYMQDSLVQTGPGPVVVRLLQTK